MQKYCFQFVSTRPKVQHWWQRTTDLKYHSLPRFPLSFTPLSLFFFRTQTPRQCNSNGHQHDRRRTSRSPSSPCCVQGLSRWSSTSMIQEKTRIHLSTVFGQLPLTASARVRHGYPLPAHGHTTVPTCSLGTPFPTPHPPTHSSFSFFFLTHFSLFVPHETTQQPPSPKHTPPHY